MSNGLDQAGCTIFSHTFRVSVSPSFFLFPDIHLGFIFIIFHREIHGLEGSEMSIILQKFGTALKTMQPSIIHSCVNQIVSITGKLRPGQVLEIFDKYFLHVQKDKDKNPQAKANTSKGRGGKRVNQPEKEVSLGIVACNFVDACRHCEPLVREVLKRVKASLFDHTLVTSPFMLTVILSMTSLDYLRAQVQRVKKVFIC